MPTGVYVRTPEMMVKIKKDLNKGRTPEIRKKVRVKLLKNAQDPKWRERVSKVTTEAMHRPEVREKHLKGLKQARETYGTNFRGGNGQELTPIVILANKLLSQCGYIREFPIPTKPVRNIFKNVPDAYKADFANPTEMIVIELDGISHASQNQKKLDQKKNKVLEYLGWTVIRLNHYNPRNTFPD